MGDSEIKYAVVLTSCGRFDLLRQTVESFLRFADVRPMQFIIVEDSGDDKVRDALAGLDFPFEFVINRPALGQDAAIDAGYALVKTPLVFHCEDDWLFFRGDFIRESFYLLEKFPKVSVVFLRGLDERKELRELQIQESDGVLFVLTYPKLHKQFFGYGYNPGLRRLADYQRVAPVAAVGDEGMVSWVFKHLGFYSAHLFIPAAAHLGWGRSSVKKSGRGFAFRLQRKVNKISARWKNRAKKLQWRYFDFPGK